MMASSTKLKPVDVVVVGAGVAGTIVCKTLAETGLRVVCLERGRMLDPQHDFAMPYAHDEFKYDRRNDLLQIHLAQLNASADPVPCGTAGHAALGLGLEEGRGALL